MALGSVRGRFLAVVFLLIAAGVGPLAVVLPGTTRVARAQASAPSPAQEARADEAPVEEDPSEEAAAAGRDTPEEEEDDEDDDAAGGVPSPDAEGPPAGVDQRAPGKGGLAELDAEPSGETPPPSADAPTPGGAAAPGGTPGRVDADAAGRAAGAAGDRADPPAPGTQRSGEAAAGTGVVVIDLSLERAIEIAIRNTFDRRIERLNRRIAHRELIVERAVFDPFFNMGFSYQRNRDPTVSPLDFDPVNPVLGVRINPFDIGTFNTGVRGNTVIGTTYELAFLVNRFNNPRATLFALNPRHSTEVALSITQPLLKNAWYAVNSANIRIAQINESLSQDNYELVVIDTVLTVINAYWDLVFAENNYQAKVNALDVTLEQLRVDRQKERVGTIAPIDLVTTEAQVALRQTEYDEALATLQTARDELLFRLNYAGEKTVREFWEDGERSPFETVQVQPTTAPDPDEELPMIQGVTPVILESRPEYRQAKHQISATEVQLEVARNGLLPSFDVQATWRQEGLQEQLRGSLDELDSGNFYNWRVGVLFEVPLHYRGPKSVYNNAIDERRKAVYEKQKLENSIPFEIRQAIRDVEFARLAVENLTRQVNFQRTILRGERTKLEAGTTVAYLVSQIENDLVAAVAQQLQAQTNLEKAKAAYYRAIGDLLERVRIEIGN